jgi:acyl-[acyl carrier protein]--UDP-N-acetylglucosamine O-acyltransferase
MIHKLALIDPSAEIDEGVSIGADGSIKANL